MRREPVDSQREECRFAGVALAIDESPRCQPRFRVLRFQITALYWGKYILVEFWGRSAGPPILKSSCIGDIMQCPGKQGVDVCNVIEKQFARVGMHCFDVAVATADG